MNGRRRYYRRADWATLALCAMLLVVCLGAVGTAGRERAKRAVCLSNLKTLTQAWRLYANDNDGQLVNGMAGIHRSDAQAWVGHCWHDSYGSGKQLPRERQWEGIRDGALWPYLQELNLYRCPSGRAGAMLTYAVVDGMNGMTRTGTAWGGEAVRIDDTVLWVRNLNEIITPGPAERMVFIDEGRINPDSFATLYQQEMWWDAPPAQHNNGITASFADGHVEYWQWKGADTIEYGWRNDGVPAGGSRAPKTDEGREDLHRLQRAVWGRLGYESTEP
jgi:prepilin-type processing-associated H-X9-DG protein